MLLTTELDKLSGTDWQLFFAQERAKPYFAELDAFVTAAAAEKTVYPAAENIFAAFRACPVSAVRVVILGQDPYHEPGQAMGLSFSVPDGCKAPPSLRNIFKELEAELGPGCAAHSVFGSAGSLPSAADAARAHPSELRLLHPAGATVRRDPHRQLL